MPTQQAVALRLAHVHLAVPLTLFCSPVVSGTLRSAHWPVVAHALAGAASKMSRSAGR
jgi:hypothetical protein